MVRSHKLILIAAAVVLSLAVFLVACGAPAAETDYEYKHKDISAYTSDELEGSADYRAFYRPGVGSVGAVMPYYENGVYYIFYEDADDPAHPICLTETADFISYTDRGKAIYPIGLAGESALGIGSVCDYGGDRYVFYTASNGGENTTVRVAVADAGFNAFTRKQDFILRAEDYGFERGFFDPDVRYDEGLNMFIAVVSTYSSGHAALAYFYIDAKLGAESAVLGGILYTDQYGFDAIKSPTFFELDGEYYITYYAEDSSLKDTSAALTGACGKMYYLHSFEPTAGFELCETPIDSAVFADAKVVKGLQTLIVGRALYRSGNSGYEYGGKANLAVHALNARSDGALTLTYPKSFESRFYLPVPNVVNKNVEFDSSNATAVKIADELQQYRLSVDFTYGAGTKEFGFVFGCGSDEVKVAIDPVFGKIEASQGGCAFAVGYIDLAADRSYRADIFVEGSAYAMYIDGTAFTFRIRNTGNKSVAAYAVGTVKFTDIVMLAADNADIFDGCAMLEIGKSKELMITAANDSYAVGMASLYAENDVTVTLSCGETEKSVSGSGFIDFYEYLAVGAGAEVKLTVTANVAGSVYGIMHVGESYFVPDVPSPCESRTATDRGSVVTVREDGYYRFEAAAVREDATDGTLAIDKDGKTLTRISLFDGFGRADGAFYAKAGSEISALVSFDDETTSYAVKLSLYSDASRESGLIPEGSCAGGNSGYDLGVNIEDGRKNKAAVASSFGEQGRGGFVYTYGKAVDEMIPLPTYDESNGFYTTDLSDKVKVGKSELSAGGGYMAGVIYVVAADGRINVSAGFMPNGDDDAFIARIYKNRIRLSERLIKRSNAEDVLLETDAVAGDRIVFAAEYIGGGESGATAAFTFEISEYAEREKHRAVFADEFYTDINDENNWLYGYSKYNFDDDSFAFTRFEQYNGNAWTSASAPGIEIKNGWIQTEYSGGDASVGYKLDYAGKYKIDLEFIGENAEETRICARIAVKDKNGNTKGSVHFIGDGATSHSWRASRTIEADEGDTVFVILFREGGRGYYKGDVNLTITEE